MRVSLAGAGRAGTHLFAALVRSGMEAGRVWDRRAEAAERAVRLAGAGEIATSAGEAAADGGVLLVAVSDGAIASVAARIVGEAGDLRGLLAAHLSGIVPASALAPLGARGAATASFHPLLSLPDPGTGVVSFAGAAVAVEGGDWACAELAALARRLEAEPFRIDAARKPVYHAGAALLGNGLVALVAAARALVSAAGLEPEAAVRALLPLGRGVLDNIARLGLDRALTGPVARGDAETVGVHLAAIRRLAPEFECLYRDLGKGLVAVASRGDPPPRPEALRAVEDRLRDESP